MKDCIKCGITCLAIGMVIGGIVVAKNKKLAAKINEGTDKASDAINDLKDNIEEKVEQAKQKAKQEEQKDNNQSSAELKSSKKKN